MIQTGLIFKLNKSDYVKDKNSPLLYGVVKSDSDWTDFLPIGEQQNKPFVFDSMSCATFAGLNVAETQIKYFVKNNLIPKEYLDYLKEIGFDTEFNGSDCFTAIMSGTTKKGNTLQAIWESFRKNGILPENKLPFNPKWNTFEEYMNQNNVTEEMKEKAKKVLEVFNFSYQFVILQDSNYYKNVQNIPEFLKISPLHSACNSLPHAVEIYKDGLYFNSYSPYQGNKVNSVQFALQGVVSINDEKKIYTTLKLGSRGLEVKKLQRKLGLKDDGIFGPKTQQRVMNFQKINELKADGIVGIITRSYLNNI